MRLTQSLTSALVTLGLVGSVLVMQAESAGAASARGRGIASSEYLKTKPHKLTAAGAGWTYNWTYRVPASTPEMDVVPMMRSAASVSDAAIATLAAGQQAGDYRYLLGFNEPDGVNQANMSPLKAAKLWPKLEKTGLILGSPAPAVPTNGWLKLFMRHAKERNLRVNFIALHFYADISDPKALARIKYQVQLIRRNYHRPIWITELGIIDRRANPGSAAKNWSKAITFMRQVTAMLDALPYVQRYAWMADKVTTRPNLKWSTLHDKYGRQTPLGVAYSKLN